MFSLKSLIVVLLWCGFLGSKRPTPLSFLDKVVMSESNDFTQNYSLQNKSSLKQTNKELLNCRFELIPLKTDWQKRLLSTTEASLRATSPFRKRRHTRAARERRHGCEGRAKGGSLSLLFLHPLRLRRSVARSLAKRVTRHEWPGACSQAVRKRDSRT